MASSKAPKGRAQPKDQPHKKDLKRKREAEDLAELETRVAGLDATGAGSGGPQAFAELPLSQATAAGLAASHFKTLTDIQRRAIPAALQGRDVLGAAKTGSGKTLAFLVPALEVLHRRRWTEHDGLGALVLAPTRELAIQIFDVLRRVGRRHQLSAGLVIGGKSVRDEAARLARINLLVSTPGRMLQHLDQTAALDVSALQLLVLDEADRILDLGFQATLDAILEHLPPDRQTLLFSATQTRKVSDLARLSLRDPLYVSVHQDAAAATPAALQQNYVSVALPDKLDTLWSFLRANSKAKILVFLSSGKQVRFVYEAFRHMQPGIPLLHLHGRQRQAARLEIVTRFSSSNNACLLATDVAARGLDFPAVDWVVQVDCPEDVDTYIHRVGRTARFEKAGRGVLFLDPSEAPAMLQRLEQRRVPVEEIKVRQKKQQSVKGQLQNMCFRDPELKYLGQKAFVSYVKSIHVQKDKDVFKLAALALDDFSTSMGLPGTPQIKFRSGEDAKALKNAPRAGLTSSEEEDENDDDAASDAAAGKPRKKPEVRTKYDRMFERRNQDVLAPHYTSMLGADGDGDGDFLTVKRRIALSDDEDESAAGSDAVDPTPSAAPAIRSLARPGQEPLLIDSRRREKLLGSKKKLLKYKERGHRVVFDDDGAPHELYEMRDEAAFAAEGAPSDLRRAFVDAERPSMLVADEADKAAAKQKRRAKKEKRKAREREARAEQQGRGAELVPYNGEGGKGGELGGHSGEDSGDEQGGYASEGDDAGQGDVSPPPREKKWFQRDSDDERSGRKSKKQKHRAGAAADEPETLEDLEALAESYL